MSFNVPPRLQVRYSPSRGTSTGASATDVGDFSELLLDVDPVPAPGWIQYHVTVPGNGRLALRFFGHAEPTNSHGNTWLELDTLSVGPPPTPPCNLPPVPRAGETVAWTKAKSPYRICQSLSIPAGGTVDVEPGVQVDFESGRQLIVAGRLNIKAMAPPHAVVTAPGPGPALLVVGGAIDARFTDFQLPFQVGDGASLLVSDCTFAAGGALRADDIPTPRPFVKLERCQFTDSE